MQPVYLNDWKDGCLAEVASDFETDPQQMEGVEILLASYSYESYEGDAFVLFRKGETLYEVNASHCSCYGLEGQWEPEETTVQALRHRMESGNLGSGWHEGNKFAKELREMLDQLDQPQPR